MLSLGSLFTPLIRFSVSNCRPIQQYSISTMKNDEIALQLLLEDGPKYYAKVTLCGRQFQSVQVGDSITTHRIKGPLVGDILRLTQVREIGSPSCTLQATGTGIPGARSSPVIDPSFFTIRARVQSHAFGKQVPAKRGKQRKGRRKKLFARPHITNLKIVEISLKAPVASR